jgi:hypothetical protein
MSNPRLPTEILDYIVDHLHDTEDALRNCCLVSKSWVPRTRKHLFAYIWFPTAESLESWETTFPDPLTSPARHAKTLLIDCPQVVTAADADAEARGWITGFSRVVHLEVGARGSFVDPVSFVPFHRLSPILKSLCVTLFALSSPHIFDLILSFPLLEDLTVTIHHKALAYNDDGSDWLPTAAQSSSPPMFTGSLKLLSWAGAQHITNWLLSLPGGIHFRKLIWRWSRERELLLMMALVERCSHTLESLDIFHRAFGKIIQHLRPHKIAQYCL